MRGTIGALLLVVLAACASKAEEGDDAAAGRALEAAARNLGIVADARDATGVYAAGEDRACLTGASPRYRIGVSIDYGDGQRCLAQGSARGKDDLAIDLGGDCRFTATRDGDRMTFPPQTPAACAAVCQGRATLDAVALDRLSEGGGETSRLRGADGKLLCAS